MLREDKDSSTRKVLCDFIGELASTIQCLEEDVKAQCSKEGTEWNELMQGLWDLLNSGNVTFMEGALRILSVLFTHCGRDYANYKNELVPLFKVTLTHEVGSINVGTMETLTAFIENVEFKHCRPFLELMPLLISQILVVLEKSEDLVRD